MEPSINDVPQSKRRKVRKGTRSCWECKGRKVKCTYMISEDTVCDGCVRRGTNCVSQEFLEQPLGQVDKRRQIGNRMVRVESLIEKLVKRVGDEEGPPGPVVSTSKSNGSVSLNLEVLTPPSVSEARTEVDALSTSGWPSTHVIETLEHSDLIKYEKISENLLATFPSQESVDMIVKTAGPIPSFFHQLLVRKHYKDVQIGEKEKRHQIAELTIRHTSKTHPLIIARQMLLLAISFRYIHPTFHNELKGFSEAPGVTMQRVAEAAIDLITTNDMMINNLEGIECLLLVASFQADSGNLRAGWSIIRRAMLTAQLMCLHRQKRPPLKSVQPANEWDPQLLWYRIVYYDRFFSLILGLPQGTTDTSMETTSYFEHDTPMGRLERRHCVLASRILQRNERELKSSDDSVDTQAIDVELRKLAESMPSKWWLVPNLASMQDGNELFWATIRLTNQVFHYILLSHLHLPFILRSSSSGLDQHHYEYSRIACVNASRDLLHRYMAFRTFNRVSYCCHSMDFFAITASMTLILAHLDGYCRSKHDSDNALVHQRTSDRALMEEILDNMEQVGILNKAKTVSERGAGVLRRLLAIEADAALGSRYRLETSDDHASDARGLRLSIPYFGVVTIIQDNQLAGSLDIDDATPVTLPHQNVQPSSHESREQPDFRQSLGDFPHAPSLDPSLTVGQENWGFQEVDMSFFDTLMRESNAYTENNDYWWLL